MQVRLKQDILSEARQFDNHILVAEEDDDMQVGAHWRSPPPAAAGCAGQGVCYGAACPCFCVSCAAWRPSSLSVAAE